MDLLEREPQLDQLSERLRQATAGQGSMVLVGGEAGVGKTTLTNEFCRQIDGTAVVLRTSCDALSTPGPLAPVRDLAPALGLRIDEHALDGEARDRLFRAVLAVFAARPEPVVVVAEDAHWADGATLELLRFLGRRIGTLPVLFVVTYRDDEIGADHPLRLVLGDLATAPAVQRISIRPLSEAAVRRLAERSGRDATTLHRLTGGNPFFVTEVLAADGERVVVSVDARGGHVTTSGWTETTQMPADAVIERLRARGVKQFVYSDVDKDGMLGGIDAEDVRRIAGVVRGRFLYSGGIGSRDHLADLAGLRQVNLAGVISGKALYERRFGVREGQEALEG